MGILEITQQQIRKEIKMEKTLITIGRQHGSGGTEVAEILAEKLNVWYYNREILYMAADKIGFDSFDEESMKELNYRKSSKYMEGLSVMMGTPGHIPVYNKMYKEQGKIISEAGRIRVRSFFLGDVLIIS